MYLPDVFGPKNVLELLLIFGRLEQDENGTIAQEVSIFLRLFFLLFSGDMTAKTGAQISHFLEGGRGAIPFLRSWLGRVNIQGSTISTHFRKIKNKNSVLRFFLVEMDFN